MDKAWIVYEKTQIGITILLRNLFIRSYHHQLLLHFFNFVLVFDYGITKITILIFAII